MTRLPTRTPSAGRAGARVHSSGSGRARQPRPAWRPPSGFWETHRAQTATRFGERSAALEATAGDGSDDQLAAGQEARPELSLQERHALGLYSSGMTLEEVASAMYVTVNTAASYLKRVRGKFRAAGCGVDSKLELRDRARTHGLVPS